MEAICQPVHIGEHEIVIQASAGISIADDQGAERRDHPSQRRLGHVPRQGIGQEPVRRLFEPFDARQRGRQTRAHGRPTPCTSPMAASCCTTSQSSTSGQRTHGRRGVTRPLGAPRVRGLLAPGSFIHLAEDSGLIVELGQWVLDESCRQLAEWQRLPGCEQLWMSVNVSVRQLRVDSVITKFTETIERTGIDPSAPALGDHRIAFSSMTPSTAGRNSISSPHSVPRSPSTTSEPATRR